MEFEYVQKVYTFSSRFYVWLIADKPFHRQRDHHQPPITLKAWLLKIKPDVSRWIRRLSNQPFAIAWKFSASPFNFRIRLSKTCLQDRCKMVAADTSLSCVCTTVAQAWATRIKAMRCDAVVRNRLNLKAR
jgi:hypothetical protein